VKIADFGFCVQLTQEKAMRQSMVCLCCSVLQCEAVCFCSVVRCVAMCCSVLECVERYVPVYGLSKVCGCVLECVAVCCSGLECVAVCCSVMWCVVVCCSVLQCVAVCWKICASPWSD